MSKICIISFFSSPAQGVGGVRAKYWSENLSSQSGGKYECDLITSNDLGASSSNIKSVPALFNSDFDQGLGWLIPLFWFMVKNAYKYEIFIFTSGPFLQLFLVPFLKIVYRKKVIIDYRDPFSYNPVFLNSDLKRFVKKNLEIFFNLTPDALITVNRFCKDLLEHPPSMRIELLDNGFDENIDPINVEVKSQKIQCVLAGSFSYGRNLEHFWKACEESDYKPEIIHMGGFELLTNYKAYRYLGLRSYNEVLGYIQLADICLVFTSGHPYESTTKIFDYLRFSKKILIISDRIENFGALFDITANNSNVVWALNDKESILSGIEQLASQSPSISGIDPMKFSRKDKLISLIRLLEEISLK